MFEYKPAYVKRCQYISYGKYFGQQCPNESSEDFCGDHLCQFYFNKWDCIIIASITNKPQQIVSFYDKRNKDITQKIRLNKSWVGFGRTIGDIKALNIYNFSYYRYKNCIKRWITMFLIFKYYVGDVSNDIYQHISYYYLII